MRLPSCFCIGFAFRVPLHFTKEHGKKQNERRDLRKNKISRPFAVIAVFLVCVILFVIVVIPVVFSVGNDAKDLINRVKNVEIKQLMTIKSNKEAAMVMKKSVRSIESILYRAKKSLKSQLEMEGIDYEKT